MEIESASMRPLLKRVEEGFWVYTQRCGYMELYCFCKKEFYDKKSLYVGKAFAFSVKYIFSWIPDFPFNKSKIERESARKEIEAHKAGSIFSP